MHSGRVANSPAFLDAPILLLRIRRKPRPIRDTRGDELGGTLDHCRRAARWKENSDTYQFATPSRPIVPLTSRLSRFANDRDRVREEQIIRSGVVTFDVGGGDIRLPNDSARCPGPSNMVKRPIAGRVTAQFQKQLLGVADAQRTAEVLDAEGFRQTGVRAPLGRSDLCKDVQRAERSVLAAGCPMQA